MIERQSNFTPFQCLSSLAIDSEKLRGGDPGFRGENQPLTSSIDSVVVISGIAADRFGSLATAGWILAES